MKGNFEEIIKEPAEATYKRLKKVFTSLHHSVFDHFKLTFEISGISKLVAMFLNNEPDYTTSEKSARYTKFKNIPGIQGKLYDKWLNILITVLKDVYPELYNANAKDPEFKIKKLAQENARYFVSINEPLTSMLYTTSLRQWNYLIYMFEDYISNCTLNSFNEQTLPAMKEFVTLAKKYEVKCLVPLGRPKKLSLIGDPEYFDLHDIFDYTYQTSFYASYACFAQTHRHRSERCFLYNLKEPSFYVPEILTNTPDLRKEWLNDSLKVKDIFPQGQIVKIVQIGTIDSFLMKYSERCCGNAQLETMRHQVEIAQKFVQNSPYGHKIIEYTHNKTARCQFENGFCTGRCMLGPNQFDRMI